MDEIVTEIADLLPHLEDEVGRSTLEGDILEWLAINDDGSGAEALADRFDQEYTPEVDDQ